MLNVDRAISVLLLLIILTVEPLLATKLVRPDKLDYATITTAGNKVGFLITEFKNIGNTAQTTTRMVLTFQRRDIKFTHDANYCCVETLDGKPISFTMKLQGSIKQDIKGIIDNSGKLNITIASDAEDQIRKIDWPEDAVLEYGSYLIKRRTGLRAGAKAAIKTIDPISLTPMSTSFIIGKKTEVDILGQSAMLTEIQLSTTDRMGLSSSVIYVDDNYETLKIIKPIMGIPIEVTKCSKETAIEPNDLFDIDSYLKPEDIIDIQNRTVLKCPTPLENLPSRKTISYTIDAISAKADLNFPITDNQTVRRIDRDRVIITVSPVPFPKAQIIPYIGNDANALASLQATDYIQCHDDRVITLAKRAIGTTKDAATAAKRIEEFVESYIKKKSLSIEYRSAIEIIESREGDCTEHAILTAALCRAVGIPTQIVSGMVYRPEHNGNKHIFVTHTWNRVLIGSKWIGLDATMETYNSGYITLCCTNGNRDDWMQLANTYGMYKITSVTSSMYR